MMDILGWLIAALLVALTVNIHYHTMLEVSDRILPWALRRLHGRRVLMLALLALLGGHILEVWVFAAAMFVLVHIPGFGALGGAFDGSFNAFLYFSAALYTSIGDGSIHPAGPIRSVIVSETLAGLMMIAWSASFTYLKMEEIWRGHRKG